MHLILFCTETKRWVSERGNWQKPQHFMLYMYWLLAGVFSFFQLNDKQL